MKNINSETARSAKIKELEGSLKNLDPNFHIYRWSDRGSDERQYCAPGVRLPLCTFCRSKFGEYPEYHSDADNLSVVTDKGLKESFLVMKEIVDSFEMGIYPKVVKSGEPQLGKRNLYPNLSEVKDVHPARLRMNFLAYSDGKCCLFDICRIINCDLKTAILEYKLLKENKIII